MDALRLGNYLLMVPHLVLKASIKGTVAVQTRVRGPHENQRLAHMTERGRYGAMPNGLTTGCEASVAHSSGENLEQMDWVGNVA